MIPRSRRTWNTNSFPVHPCSCRRTDCCPKAAVQVQELYLRSDNSVRPQRWDVSTVGAATIAAAVSSVAPIPLSLMPWRSFSICADSAGLGPAMAVCTFSVLSCSSMHSGHAICRWRTAAARAARPSSCARSAGRRVAGYRPPRATHPRLFASGRLIRPAMSRRPRARGTRPMRSPSGPRARTCSGDQPCRRIRSPGGAKRPTSALKRQGAPAPAPSRQRVWTARRTKAPAEGPPRRRQ